MGRRTQNTQPQAEVTEATEATPSPEELMEELTRLRQELEEERSKPKRKPRERRMTPKQRRLVQHLAANPEATIGEACEAAGATATSHGLVFRMIEDGYLVVRPSDQAVADSAPAEGEGEESESTEEQPAEETSAA